MNKILIVRLGALGDLIHTIPAAAAIRRALPDARIDWLVDARHRELLDLVPMIDRTHRDLDDRSRGCAGELCASFGEAGTTWRSIFRGC